LILFLAAPNYTLMQLTVTELGFVYLLFIGVCFPVQELGPYYVQDMPGNAAKAVQVVRILCI